MIIVMPESAPRIKFENTRRYGAEVRTYDITTDHKTGVRDRLAKEISEQGASLASIALRRSLRDRGQRGRGA